MYVCVKVMLIMFIGTCIEAMKQSSCHAGRGCQWDRWPGVVSLSETLVFHGL